MKKDELLEEIEKTREKMNKMGAIKSLVDAEVVSISQYLDQLFNIYEKMKEKEG